ncbi:hypothetical protein CW714_00470 [Methanophagales archaeon]|nr:MAG: hypothetical protein CW714_00470 [Methanophagales archaeon]
MNMDKRVKKRYLVGIVVIIVIGVGIMSALYFHQKGTKFQEKSPQTELQEELASTKALLTVPVGCIHNNFIQLKPGEKKETYYTLYTRNGGPGEVTCKIYRVAHVYEKEKMTMPEGLNVSIEPSKFIAQPHKNYTSKITVKTSPELFPHEVNVSVGGIAGREYTLYLRVIFEGENETIGDDWLRILVRPFTVPGASGLYLPHGYLHNNSITLKLGETKETYYTLHTGESGPEEVSYDIYRITGKVNMLPMPEEEKLPIPEGLTVSIEPNNFLARTHENYTSKITVKTSPELLPGEYVLCMEAHFGGRLTNDWLTVNVEP